MSIVASVSAVAIASPSIAGEMIEPDPIFGLIAAHRQACAADSKVLDRLEVLEKSLPKYRRTWYSNIHEPEPPEGLADDPAWIECEQASLQTSGEVCEAMIRLVSTPATTMEGLVAQISYCATQDELPGLHTGEFHEWGGAVYCNTAEALVQSIAKALPKFVTA